MLMIANILTWIERSRLRKALLRLDERRLNDIGYSRTLLEAGMRYWPWRTPTDPTGGLGRFRFETGPREPGIADAVAELKAYSDAELADLDLTRGTIEHAVRHGRPGYPQDQRRAA